MSDSKSEDTSVEKQIYEILKTTDAWLSNPLEEVRDSAYMQELLQLIERSKLEARINELKKLEPPEQYADYAKLMGSEQCNVCGFNAIRFGEHVKDRIKALTKQRRT